MTRKAAWILVLLAGLLALSVSVAFASSVTRPAQASVAPNQELSTAGDVTLSTLSGVGIGRYKLTHVSTYGYGRCREAEEAAAY